MQVLSLASGAIACFTSLPAVIVYVMSERLSCRRGLVIGLLLCPSSMISYYHATSRGNPWLFALGGAVVAAIPPSFSYTFYLALACGWKATSGWQEENKKWRHGFLMSGLLFWPFAAMQFIQYRTNAQSLVG